MAKNILSQVIPAINNYDPLITSWLGDKPAVLSTEVAAHFQKRHQHILRDIDRLRSILPKSFTATNFGCSDYQDSTGRKIRQFILTRDAFSLLVMGMTGPAAIRWKLRYIEAFNAMERELLERHDGDLFLAGARAAAQRLAGEERARLADCALALLDEGLTQREVGKLLRVSRWTVRRLKRRFGFLAAPKAETHMVQGVLA